ncbi:MAG: carbamoyltransferase HypF [Firmicutes bacterium]|nr:carbamoyltransferase HypF [Bacillota bacterium]
MSKFRGIEAPNTAHMILQAQGIIAVKGLGGYHLVCDARSIKALTRLRKIKKRPYKPFAVMFRDLKVLQSELHTPAAAVKLLTSWIRPIVILARQETSTLPDLLAPDLDTIGAMLPYMALYLLLFDESLDVLVVTSANRSGEPIIFQDDVAKRQLAAIVDGILIHDHKITNPLDDSVLYCVDIAKIDQPKTPPQGLRSSTHVSSVQPQMGELESKEQAGSQPLEIPTFVILRRGRGYMPSPLPLSEPLSETILGCGSDLKACFCLGQGPLAYPGPHLGNLEHPETLDRYRFMLRYYQETFDLEPVVVAHDLNPALVSSQIVASEDFADLTPIPIQHQHAHIAACMEENKFSQPVIGIAYDGTGYGWDGRVWGGEILLASPADFRRLAHWQNVPLPGNDIAIYQPWRMALSYLQSAGLEESSHLLLENLPGHIRPAAAQILSLWGSVQASWLQTSSMGRLFDGITALLGLCLETTYTGQPAILLENAAWRGIKRLGLDSIQPYVMEELINSSSSSIRDHLPKPIPLTALIRCVAQDRARNIDTTEIAARFHRSIAEVTAVQAHDFCRQFNIGTVALSGGVWQNQLLCHWTAMLLEQMGLEVIRHKQLSPGDECLGFGQIVIAGARLKAEALAKRSSSIEKEVNHPCAWPYRQE